MTSGLVIETPSQCRQCRERWCSDAYAQQTMFDSPGDLQAKTCRRGVDYARVETAFGPIVIAGVFLQGLHSERSRRLKRELADNIVKLGALQSWADSMRTISSELFQANEAGGREALSAFHDVKTALSAVFRAADQVVQDATERRALSPDSPSLVSLQKSVDFLSRRLRLMDLVANPAAASLGRKRQVQLYKAVDRIVRTLELSARTRNVRLQMQGTSHRDIIVYDSFDIIPLVLLDNAAKYSREGEEVTVDITNVGQRSVKLSVTSFSPHIPESERAVIFERGKRGTSAEIVTAQGSGIGLHVAQMVARAHDTKIILIAGDPKVGVGGIAYAVNRFEILFP